MTSAPEQPIRTPVSDSQFRQFQIFKDVDLNAIRPILDGCQRQFISPGDIILQPEQGNDVMYLLLSGRVAVYLESLDTQPLLELGAGECLGEMSVFDGHNPSAYVRAEQRCEVVVVDRKALWQLIDCSHALCRSLLHFLSNRLRSGNDLVALSKSKQRQQEQVANNDALTGLNNRRWLDEVLLRLKGKQLSELMPLVVLMLDVDYFKRINDNYGHRSGDLVLQMVARALRENLRPHDMVARYGGEEFMVLLPHTANSKAVAVAERLRGAVEELHLMGADQEQPLPPVTISIGVAAVNKGEAIDAVVEAADKALYRAKNNGRNRIESR